jgi:hypothetical protein
MWGKYELHKYKVGYKNVYYWAYEDEDGSTKTLTLEEFGEMIHQHRLKK